MDDARRRTVCSAQQLQRLRVVSTGKAESAIALGSVHARAVHGAMGSRAATVNRPGSGITMIRRTDPA